MGLPYRSRQAVAVKPFELTVLLLCTLGTMVLWVT